MNSDFNTHLATQIAHEPATQGRFDAILWVAQHRALDHLPEPESLLAAVALDSAYFLHNRYGSRYGGHFNGVPLAKKLVPSDWRDLALSSNAARASAAPGRKGNFALPRKVCPGPVASEPAIVLQRAHYGSVLRFSEHPNAIAIEPARVGRNEATLGWLLIGAVAGHLGVDFQDGRRFFELRDNTYSEVPAANILPFLEVGKWLGLRPEAASAIHDPNDPDLTQWRGLARKGQTL